MNKKMGLAVYSLGHLLVDGACCLVMLVSVSTAGGNIKSIGAAIILYNAVAFALQPFFGLYADKKGRTNIMAFLGCILVAASVTLMQIPYGAAVVAGLGNAMYHIGGGIYSLNMDRRRAAYAGIFVAPGAMGLFLGGFISRTIPFCEGFVLIPMLLTGLAVLNIRHLPVSPKTLSSKTEGLERTVFAHNTALPLLLLFLVIMFRSIIGSVGVYSWNNQEIYALILILGITVGKAMGGFLSDWAGRKKTAVIALLLSAPLLAFGESVLVASIAGIVLFNLTMPITLTEMADCLHGYSGFAFGLTTLALVLGMFFIYFGYKEVFGLPWVTFALIIFSAVMLYFSIRSERKKISNKGVQCNENELVQNSR